MIFRIDPSAPEPLFSQIATQVRLAVASGELSPGERLPAARTLAESLDLLGEIESAWNAIPQAQRQMAAVGS